MSLEKLVIGMVPTGTDKTFAGRDGRVMGAKKARENTRTTLSVDWPKCMQLASIVTVDLRARGWVDGL